MQRDFIPKGRGLGGSSDLTLVATLKSGFVDSLEAVTYKTRTKRVLETLHRARNASHEQATARLLSDSVERVGVIQSVRVVVLEPENKVMLAVSFDGSWEAYIRVLWDKVGTLLDLIFCGTVDYVTARDHSFEQWLVWAKRVQVETGFFYGPPDSSAIDTLYQRRLERMRMRGAAANLDEAELNELRAVVPSAEEAVQRLIGGRVPLPDDPPIAPVEDTRMVRECIRNGLQGLAALYRLADLHRPGTADGDVLRHAAIDLLREFVKMRDAQLISDQLVDVRTRFARELDWIFPGDPLVKTIVPRQRPPDASSRGPIPAALRGDIQGGILRPYNGVTHGVVLLLAFDDPLSASELFAYLDAPKTRLAVDADPHDAVADQMYRNIALTPAGLRAAGMDDDTLESFPDEFRQGMAARAGALGDVRNNHPRRWRLPQASTAFGPQKVASGSTAHKPRDMCPVIELEAVHAVLQLRCRHDTNDDLEVTLPSHPLHAEVRQLLAANPRLRLLSEQSMKRQWGSDSTGQKAAVDHFGYVDGDGQPQVEAGPVPFDRNRIHLGEIVLGQENAADEAADANDPRQPPAVRERLRWLANGSFLVLRKYRQFPERLDAAVKSAVERMAEIEPGSPLDPGIVYAKLMGRYRDGLPLVENVPGQPNLFSYDLDPQGRQCPLHAHVRRANPRLPLGSSARPPRLMRRGMSYGPRSGDAERGLMFMAYNASIGEQFEVVQRWLAGGNSTGSSSAPGCPIVGVPENGFPRQFRFETEIDGRDRVGRVELETGATLFEPPPALTQLEWGMYLFAPSVESLRRLRALAAAAVNRQPARSVPWQIERGRNLVAALEQRERDQGAAAAAQGWKAALEDPESIDRFDSASIWAAIREDHGGLLRTPYGVLVASRELIAEVLLDADERYSVSGQFERMKRSFGEIYLGRDAGPVYERESVPINDEIGKLGEEEVFTVAFGAAKDAIDAIVAEAIKQSGAVGDLRFEVGFDAREVADAAVAAMCESWFGLQDDPGHRLRRGSADWAWQPGQPPLYPGHFTALSRNMFQPNPGPTAVALGEQYGQALREAVRLFVADHRAAGSIPRQPGSSSPAPLARAAFEHPMGRDDDFVARNIVGVLMGFIPTTIGAALNILREWQRVGRFGALRAELARTGTGFAAASKLLAAPVAAAAGMRPMPQLTWRTSRNAHRFGGLGAAGVELEAGDKLVLGLVSGTQQSLADGEFDGRLMFGGIRAAASTPHPTHACPGYTAGMGALFGILTALLSRPETLRPGGAPLSFVLEGQASVAEADRPIGALALMRQEMTHPIANRSLIEAASALAVVGATTAPVLPEVDRREGVVLGWGDSWLDYRALLGPIPVDLGTDLRDWLEKWGYTVRKKFCDWVTYPKAATMAADTARFCAFLKDEIQMKRVPRAILLSAGGNDSTQGALLNILRDRKAGLPVLDPGKLEAHIAMLERSYVTLLTDLGVALTSEPSVRVIVHGYDYPIPDGQMGLENWLRKPFDEKNYDRVGDRELSDQAMVDLIDALNEMLIGLAKRFAFVRYVDLRKTIQQRWPANPKLGWQNDLHPTTEAFALLAAKIDAEIQK